MTNYRQMRRQARLARRSGLQPMMMINTGDGFPETVGVVLLRGAWRYRSELAPVGVAAGWWRPPGGCTTPGRTGGSPSPCWPAWPRGRWPCSARGGGCPTLPERVYAAVTIYAGGIWLSVAIAIGPFFRPLLQAGDNCRAYPVHALVGASAAARESRA